MNAPHRAPDRAFRRHAADLQRRQGADQIKPYCVIDGAARSPLGAAMRQMQLSARAYHRILKLGRTITDLCREDRIGTAHIAEAIQYRPRRQGQNLKSVTASFIQE